MIGSWRGDGVIEHASLPQPVSFTQTIDIGCGADYLDYRSAIVRSGTGEPLEAECGYWRLPDPPDAGAGEPGVEAVICHPTGIVEVYLGQVRGATVELATDLVARTSTAHAYTAAKRMYGQVEGDLLWVLEVAMDGQPMGAYSSARLTRAPA
ncbi:MAG: FABP family protein [Micrococcales bacterium]|nr:MAG: FABP family protein [Micrococcales bacterium]